MSHSKDAPQLPQIVDEAADSPRWLPALGFGLFVVVAVVIGARILSGDSTATPVEPPAGAAAGEHAP
jgi:hypothetical protein